MSLTFANIEYENNHASVSWRGLKFTNNGSFLVFLKDDVASRLDDTSGRDDFSSHLKGLSLTGMGQKSLKAVLNADVPEERAWAAGEALAEAYLIHSHGVVFPWNMERDKRNPFGSLPGADIVGFINDGLGYRFALGEVKTSGEQKIPPQVMSGRSGQMGHQIDKLANNLTIINQLLRWLLPRVKGTKYESVFDQASIAFFNSGNKQMAIFGVLIRDTSPNELDLSGRGKVLRKTLVSPTNCNLVALYLPWSLDQLIDQIRGGVLS
ncbi:hypothetical protein MSSIT_0432 [Methanosarcina siciliae T4/M]|uniref:Anti-bacteriophage protein A/HamA C-terminal domain-containing protein n=1 Tax=Methanosarcina siciliae T4/M TaxID=1434120 RepID=A0A0E3L7P9_9EURY|nr:hypothetical protein [Methanosarcina siciliae]AKB27151.1 hypothetical protein MSSIT_0432 [Methanosarcina siciliae T4/M]